MYAVTADHVPEKTDSTDFLVGMNEIDHLVFHSISSVKHGDYWVKVP